MAAGKLPVGNNTLAKLILAQVEEKRKEVQQNIRWRTNRGRWTTDYYAALRQKQEELGTKVTPQQRRIATELRRVREQQDVLHKQEYKLRNQLDKAGLILESKGATLIGTQSRAQRLLDEDREARLLALREVETQVLVGLASGTPEQDWVKEILQKLAEV